jgi:hypothetical protein
LTSDALFVINYLITHPAAAPAAQSLVTTEDAGAGIPSAAPAAVASPMAVSNAAPAGDDGGVAANRALEADPHYARASSLLAWCYAARAQLGWSEPSEELERALAMARQAIEQDWEDPWAHLAAGVRPSMTVHDRLREQW